MKGSETANARRGGIQLKLMGILIPVLAVSVAVLVAVTQTVAAGILRDTSEELLEASAVSAVNAVSAWTADILGHLDAQRDVFEYMDLSPEEELAYVRHTKGINPSCPGGIYVATENREVYANWDGCTYFSGVNST